MEGAAVFTYSRSDRQIAMYMAVKLKADDAGLLEALQEYFGGIGTIYRVAPTTYYFRVCRREDLERIVRHFDEFPMRGSKAVAYVIWREMVELKQKYRRPPREQLAALAKRLSTATARKTVLG